MTAFDVDEVENTQEGIKSLRSAYKKLAAEHETVLGQLRDFQAKESTATVESFLSSKNLNPALAKFYTADDKSEKALAAWLDENSALFAPLAAAQQQAEGENGEAGGEQSKPDESGSSTVPPEVQEATRRMSGAASVGTPAGEVGDAALVKRLKEAKSYQETVAILAEARGY